MKLTVISSRKGWTACPSLDPEDMKAIVDNSALENWPFAAGISGVAQVTES